MNTNNSTTENRTGREAPPRLEIYPSDLWRGFLRFWWLCLIFVLLGTGIMFYKSYIRFTPKYSASVTFTVQTAENGVDSSGITSYSFYYNRSTASQLSATFPYILQSNILQDIIMTDLELQYMPAALTASTVSGTNLFTMTATGSDPQLTYDVLISAMENYPYVAEYVIGNTELTILSEPSVPTVPENRLAWRRSTAKGAAAGLCAGFALIVLYALLRKTVRTKRDIREKLNQHCLGVLPGVTFKKHRMEIDRSVLLTNPMIGNGFLEALRDLRISVLNLMGDGKKVLLVTSAAPGEGKTTLTVNLAAAIASSGKNVLLVDADLRNPSISELIGGEKTGLSEKERPSVSVRRVDSLGLSLLTFNISSSKFWKMMQADFWDGLFRDLREEYDFILVDTPPCALISDPAVIAESADAAILAIRQDTVRISRIQYALDLLQSANANIIGCVLNGASSGVSGYGYNYGYGHYGYGKEKYGYGSDSRRVAK
ncbi:MAG: polysaccharide biosynthesis tyrosine autokinase [Clostridiales bacterium]|nr:polysaccharide biosynthesis tyrosine autokinase [Clostridiales bacterium]